MESPVDLLADFSQGEQERLSEEYMKSILCTNPDTLQKVTLANRTQVSIGLTNVGFVPLYGTNDKQKVLALFSPSDQLTAVALYLRNRWWTIDEILKTGNAARDGILQVQTVGERIVLYTLNRVVYRAHEMSSEELPFLCHAETDYAKVLWKNGEAVGFYSVKPPGSLCSVFSTQRYQLPVMDSIFVRKCHRGNGFGVQMLEDFVSSFRDDCLGVRYPVSKAMFKVCEMYLSQYPGDKDVLWEVEGVGSPKQRTNIANKIHTMNMSAVSRNLSFTEKSIVSSELIETDVVMEEITSHNKNNESVQYTVQISEEVTTVKGAKDSEIDEIPVTTRVRSSGLKQRKIREETEEVSSTPTPDTAVLTSSELPEKIEADMKQTLLDEEPQTPEIPKLQRAMVVIVDLKASCHEPQVEEMEEITSPTIETRSLRSKTKAVADIAQKRRPLREKVLMAETDKEEMQREETEEVSINLTSDTAVTTLNEAPEQAEVGVSSSEEAEAPVAEKRKRGRPAKAKIVHNQQKEAEVEEKEQSTTAEDIKVQEEDEIVEKPAEIEKPKTDSEPEGENTEQESGTPEDKSKEQEIEAEKEHTKENEKEKGEGVEVETPEVEPAPVSVEGEEKVEGVTQESPLEELATEGNQKIATVEMVEDEIVLSEEAEKVSPTPSPDSAMVTASEPAPVSVEEEEQVGVQQQTPLAESATEENQELSAVERVEDEIASNDETDKVTATPIPDTDVDTPSEVSGKIEDSMTQPPADEEPQKEVTSQMPKLQRASVVLVDLKATCQDPQIEEIEETPIQQSVSAEKTDEEAAPSVVEEEVQMEAAVTEEPMAETNTEQNQLTAVVETVQNEDDGVSTNLTSDSAVTTLTEVPEQANIEVNSSEEAESPVAAIRTLRGRKKSVEVTPTRKSTRQKQQDEDKEEPVVKTRVLRGRKSAPAEATPSPKSTRSKQQAEKKGKEAAAVETNNDVEEPVVETRVLRKGRKSAPVAPRRESKRGRKGQKEAEEEEQEEPIAKVQKDDVTVETGEEKEKVDEVEAESPEVEPAPVSVEGEEQVEGVTQEPPLVEPATGESQDVAAVEMVEDTTVPSEEAEEVLPTPSSDLAIDTPSEPAPVSVEEEEKVGVTQDTPLAEPATEEGQEVAAVQTVEDEIENNDETEVSSTPIPDKALVTPNEVPEKIEDSMTQPTADEEPQKEVTSQIPKLQKASVVLSSSEEAEAPVAEKRKRGRPAKAKIVHNQQKEAEVEEKEQSTTAEDIKVQEEDEIVEKPADKALVTPNEVPEKIEDSMTQPTADEEPQKEVTSQIPKLQKASVVLVDLKATCHDPQIEEIEETPIQQSVSAEKTDEEAAPSVVEEEVQMEAAVTEEPMAETNTEQNQLTAVVETCGNETEDDGASTNLTSDSAVTTLTEVPEQANIEVNSSEEAESPVAAIRTLRGRKKSVEATPTRKSTRQKQQDEDKEEPVVKTRVLRGRKSAPAEATPSPKSTRSKQQAEKKGKEAAAVETNNDVEEPVVETRVLRKGRKSAPVAPRRESKRGRKGQKEAEEEEQEEPIAKVQKDDVTVETPEQRNEPKTDKEAEGENIEHESGTPEDESEEPEIKDIKVQEEDATVETPEETKEPMADKETGENTEKESGTPEDESEVPEIEAEKEHTEENELETEKAEGVEAETPETESVPVEEEEQVEGVTRESKTPEDESKEPELEAHKENTEENEVATDKGEELEAETQTTEVEPAPVSVEEEEQGEGVTQETPLAEPATEESQKVSLVERVEEEIAPIVEAEELSPTPTPDSSMVTPSEPAPVSVEEEEQVRVTQETPLAEPASKESQEVAAVEIVEDELANNEETGELGSTPAPDAAVLAPSEGPENIEDSMTQTPADEEHHTEVTCQIPKLCENEIVQIEETNEVSTDLNIDPIVTISSSEEAEVTVATTRTMRERKKTVEPAPRRTSTRQKQLEENKHVEEVAVESSNDDEEAVVETRVLRRGRKSAPVKSTPSRKSTRGNPEEKKDKDEPDVETRVLRRGRKSAPVAPRRESKRARKQLKESEDEEQEEPISKVQKDDVTVETPEKTDEPKTDKEAEGGNTEQESGTPEDESEEPEMEDIKVQEGDATVETQTKEPKTDMDTEGGNTEQESGTHEDESEVPEIDAEKEHTEENELETENGEGVEAETPEPEPVSAEKEEQVEGAIQEPPLAEPTTDESQEVAVGERLDDEMKQQQGEEKEEEPVEAESQEEEAPVVETQAPPSDVPEKTELSAPQTPAEEEPQSPQIAILQRTTVVLVDLKTTCNKPPMENIDETTPDYDENSKDDIKAVPAEAVIDSNDEEDNATEQTANEETEKPVDEDTPKRRSTRERPEVDYDENSNDDIKTVSTEAVIDSNDEEDKVSELTASEETEKPEQDEAAKGIDVTNIISGESEEDNVIKLALEEDEEEETAETAEEEGRDELAISKESPKVETRTLRNRTKAEAVTPKIKSKRRHRDEEEVEEVESPKRRPKRNRPEVDYSEKRPAREREESSSDEEQEKTSPKVKSRALRNRTKAEADTPKMKSKRRHRDEEEVEPPKRRSTRQRPEVDYSKDDSEDDSERAARERDESDEEQEKISPSDQKRILRKRTSTGPTPVRRSKRAASISE